MARSCGALSRLSRRRSSTWAIYAAIESDRFPYARVSARGTRTRRAGAPRSVPFDYRRSYSRTSWVRVTRSRSRSCSARSAARSGAPFHQGTEPAHELSRKMLDAWVQFARSGDPSHEALGAGPLRPSSPIDHATRPALPHRASPPHSPPPLWFPSLGSLSARAERTWDSRVGLLILLVRGWSRPGQDVAKSLGGASLASGVRQGWLAGARYERAASDSRPGWRRRQQHQPCCEPRHAVGLGVDSLPARPPSVAKASARDSRRRAWGHG